MAKIGKQTYQRARTPEQKQQRLDDILDATEKLLDAGSYRDITMSGIAEALGYSRANLSHYVASKEEILLLLYVRSLKDLLDGLKEMSAASIDASTVEGLKDAAGILAAKVASHKDFGRIGALLASIVETNVSLECLMSCKQRIIAMMDEGSNLLVSCGLFNKQTNAMRFLLDLSNYVSGLYPAAHPLPIQQKAAKETGYPTQVYEDALRDYLTVQLAGYRFLGRSYPRRRAAKDVPQSSSKKWAETP